MPAYELIVVGASWGGLRAVSTLLDNIPSGLGCAIAIAQHRSPESNSATLTHLLQEHALGRVMEAEDKLRIEPNTIYVAPPDYHLLVEDDGSFALSVDDRVQFARPSIDVLFESAADVYAERTIGIVLTGANQDGAAGLARIKDRGGVAIVQDPATAERATMPEAAAAATTADAVLKLEQMGAFLYGLCCALPDGDSKPAPQQDRSAV